MAIYLALRILRAPCGSSVLFALRGRAMAMITIDGSDYDTDALSGAARGALGAFQFTEAEIYRLQGELAAMQLARNAYARAEAGAGAGRRVPLPRRDPRFPLTCPAPWRQAVYNLSAGLALVYTPKLSDPQLSPSKGAGDGLSQAFFERRALFERRAFLERKASFERI